jgi:tetratricopeptide (TPR) repeat protein
MKRPMIANRENSKIRYLPNRGCASAIAAVLLTLVFVWSAAAQDRIPRLPQELESEVKQVERGLDEVILYPKDLDNTKVLLSGAAAIAETRGLYQGNTWWETRDARRRMDDLKRILAMSSEQRQILIATEDGFIAAFTLYNGGHYKEAEGPIKTRLEAVRRIWGEDDPNCLSSLKFLALIYKKQKLYADAETLMRQTLAISKRALGEDHPSYAGDLSALGSLFGEQAMFGPAEQLMRQALSIDKGAVGEHHPHYTNELAYIAQIERAKTLNQEQLREWIEAQDDGQKALDLDNEGRYGDAVSYQEKSLEIRKKLWGEEGPEYLNALSNLAEMYNAQGRYDQAESLLQQVLTITKRKRMTGKNDPEIAVSLNNLAGLYADQGRNKEAGPLMREALAIDKEALGENSAVYGRDLNNLANVYERQGRYAEAEPMLLQAVRILKDTSGEADPVYATSLSNLAELYGTLDRYSEAERLSKEVLEIKKKILGKTHPDYAISLNNLAVLYESQGRYGEALPLLQEASEIHRKSLGEDHPSYAISLDNLAELYETQRRYDEAETLRRRAVEIEKKALGEENPIYAKSLNLLASLYEKQGRYDEAEPLFKRALALRKSTLGENHPDYASSLSTLALLYQAQGKYVEAEALYQQASEILKNALGEEHQDFADCLGNLSIVLAASQHWAEASAEMAVSTEVLWKHAAGNLGALSAHRQRQWLGRFIQGEILWSMVFAGHASGLQGLQAVLWRKQLALEALRQQSAALRNAVAKGTPEWQRKFEEWEQWRQEYEALGVQSLDEQSRKPVNLNYLRDLKQKMDNRELELRQNNPTYSQFARLKDLRVEDVRRGLHGGDALIEYVRYRPYDYKATKDPWGAAHYGALIMRGDGGEVQAIELGDAAGVDAVVKQYREKMDDTIERFKGADPSAGQLKTSERDLAEISSQLREKVWDKLEPFLTGVKRVYVGPDGQLSLMPLEALARQQPVGAWRYLTEDMEIVYVGTARDLARLVLTEAVPGQSVTKGKAVLVGAPAFGATQRELAEAIAFPKTEGAQIPQSMGANEGSSGGTLGTGPCSTLQSGLPRAFAAVGQLEMFTHDVEQSLLKHGWTVEALNGRDASKEAVLRIEHPDLLQFATHGFFAPHEADPCNRAGAAAEDDDGDALLHSMLILAGYNHRGDGDHVFYRVSTELLSPGAAKARGFKEEDLVKAKEDVGDGILTAYEVTGMDLDGTRLVNLTACQTGVGTVTAEGVVGLREGFLLAGARALTMSMWEVPAVEATQQMHEFYDRWLGTTTSKGSQYEAFHATQLTALHRARNERSGSGHPFYWAGIIYVGDPGDLATVAAATTAQELPAGGQKK